MINKWNFSSNWGSILAKHTKSSAENTWILALSEVKHHENLMSVRSGCEKSFGFQIFFWIMWIGDRGPKTYLPHLWNMKYLIEVCQGFYITALEPLGSPMRWKPLLPPFCRWVNGGFAGWMTWVETIRTGIQVPFCLTHGLNGTATGDAGGEAGQGVCRVPGQTRAYKACHIAGFLQKQSVDVLCVRGNLRVCVFFCCK